MIANNTNPTSQPPPQLKPHPSYPTIPSHANINSIAVARAAALSNPTQHHHHLQHHHNQQPPKSQQPSIMTGAPNPNTIIKPSKKRSTKRGATTPTVTMATTNNPTTTNNTSVSSGSNSTTTSTGGENTGRWTAEEHRLFLQGLEQHGKGWKKIASLIKSRTVVQIRTHAQKYFQKLAKARQNGEEGDVSMEGRGNGPGGIVGGVNGGLGMGHIGGGIGGGMGNGVGVGNLGGAGCNGIGGFHGSKRRRQTTGTKRKAISSVVTSMQREVKRMTTDEPLPQHHQGGAVVLNGNTSLPAIAPVLSPFLFQPTGAFTQAPVPGVSSEVMPDTNVQLTIPSITTAHHGTIPGSALEDSLFRFLTPVTGGGDTTPPLNTGQQQLNNVARQAGANPITLPSNKMHNTTNNTFSQSQLGSGDVSPTGVADLGNLPNWVWGTEAPAWYNKGADVDELLNEADALDWLADSGDLNETYEPATVSASITSSEEDEEQHRQAVAAAAAVVAEVQGQCYEQEQVHHQDPSGIVNGFNTGNMNLPPSLPSLSAKSNIISSGLAPQFIASDSNIPETSIPHDASGNMVETVPSIHLHPASMNVNMPPLPSLFESGNSINVLNEMRRKDSSVSAVGVGNLSSSSLFVSANDSTDGFFGDGTLEEEEFVTALLD